MWNGAPKSRLMRLALHIGHGKTGSSALQSWLAQHAGSLLAEGIAYPLRSPVSGRVEQQAQLGLFSMGNGFVFDELLDTGTLRQGAWVPSEAHTLAFSCERWTRQWRNRWPAILNAALAADLRPDVLLFVRDPVEHAYSLYRQMVIAHGYSGDLDSWLGVYDLPEVVLEVLEALQQLEIPWQVHNYSRCFEQLQAPMLTWLNLPQSWLHTYPLSQKRVNAAPSKELLEQQLALNCTQCIDAVAQPQTLVAASPQAQDAMLHRLHPVLERLNRLLPSEAKLLFPR